MLYNYLGTLKTEQAKFVVSVPTIKGGTLSYNGNVQSPEWEDYDENYMTLVSGDKGVNAGTYTAVFQFKYPDQYMWSDHTTGDKSIDWEIKKATLNIDLPVQVGTLTYNGSVQSPTWSDYNTSQLQISGAVVGTDAGEYTTEFYPTSNYEWPDGTSTPKIVKWSIGYASITTVPSIVDTLEYTGSTLYPTWQNYNPNQLTISGQTNGINVGSYTTSFTPTANYQWSDGTKVSKNVTWTIDRAKIASVPTQSGSLNYTGKELTPTWDNYNSSQLTIGGQTTGTNVGTYTATFTPTENYKWYDNTTTSKDAVWSILKVNNNLSVEPTSVTLTAENPSQIITVDWDGDGAITVECSDKNVADVSYSDGKITVNGLKTGTATITVSISETANYASSSIEIMLKADLPVMYTVSADVKPDGSGTVDGARAYAENAQATLVANPADDFTFVGWETTKSRLPNGYTELSYVQCQQTTSSIPCSNSSVSAYPYADKTRVVMEITPIERYGSYPQYVFSGINGSGTIAYFLRQNSSSQIAYQVGTNSGSTTTGYSTATYSFTDGTRVLIDMDPANKTLKIGTSTFTISPYTQAGPWSTNNIFIGKSSILAESYTLQMKVHSFKVYNSEVLNCDLIPCKEDSTGNPGFYDLVSDKFISVTGKFTNGDEVPAEVEIVSTSPTYSFIVTGNTHFTARFKAIVPTYTIEATPNPNEGGVVTGTGVYEEGEDVSLEATANEGYSFKDWQENGTESTLSTENPYNFLAVRNLSLSANFELSPYTAGVDWWVSPTPFNASFYGTAYGDGVFVITPYNSKFAYSTDNGKTWEISKLSTYSYWYSVVYGNGVFVAVSYAGKAAYSVDKGKAWTESVISSTENWRCVTYGDGIFVAISYSGLAAYSTDFGKTWNTSVVSTYTGWYSVAYGDGVFVTVSNGKRAAYSEDGGKTWNASTLPVFGNFYCIAYGNKKFVASGSLNSNVIVYSINGGKTWNSSPVFSNHWKCIIYGDEKFVALQNDTSNDKVAYSKDGITWEESIIPLPGIWENISYGNGTYISVSSNKSTAFIYSNKYGPYN